jgi:uncharacterized membrane protein
MHQIRTVLALVGVITSLVFMTFVLVATTLPTFASRTQRIASQTSARRATCAERFTGAERSEAPGR